MRLCSRPACSDPAGATLGYDYSRRRAWLEPLAPELDPSVHDLCDRHADLLAVPRGWTLDDLREADTAEPAEALAGGQAELDLTDGVAEPALA